MDSGLKLMAFIALFGIAVLSFYSIIILNNLSKNFIDISSKVQDLIKELTQLQNSANKTLDNVNELKQDVNIALKNLDEMKDRVEVSLDNYDATSIQIRSLASTTEDGIQKLFKTLEPVESLVNNVYERVAPPVNQTLNVINAIGKAFNVFKGRF